MRFDSNHKVLIDSMTQEEARAFCIFLSSEIQRHWLDIEEAKSLMGEVRIKYNLEV